MAYLKDNIDFTPAETPGIVTLPDNVEYTKLGDKDPLAPPQGGGDVLSAEDLKWSEALRSGIGNLDQNLADYFRGVVMLMKDSPQLAEGALEHIQAGGTGDFQASPEARKTFDRYNQALTKGLVEHYKQRYGSLEGFKQAVASDLLGVVTDAASVFIPAVKTLEVAANVAKMSRVASVANKAGKVAAFADPATVVQKTTGAAIRKMIPKGLPARWYQSAAKLKAAGIAERKTLTSTALNEKMYLTVRSFDKMERKIFDLRKKVDDMVDAAEFTGRKLDVKGILDGYSDLWKEAPHKTAKAISARKEMKSILQEVIKSNSKVRWVDGKRVVEFKKLTPTQANSLKRGIYKEIEGFFNTQKHSRMGVKTQKLIARNTKEFLEDIFPEIKNVNEKMGAMIEVRNAIGERVGLMTNQNLTDMGIAVRGAAGQKIAGKAGAAAGVAMGILDTDRVKSALAVLLHNMKKKGMRISPNSTIFKLGIAKVGDLAYDLDPVGE
jgi:hypothetical protein